MLYSIVLFVFLNPFLWVTAVVRCSIMSGSNPGRIEGTLNQMPCSPQEPVHPRGAMALLLSVNIEQHSLTHWSFEKQFVCDVQLSTFVCFFGLFAETWFSLTGQCKKHSYYKRMTHWVHIIDIFLYKANYNYYYVCR